MSCPSGQYVNVDQEKLGGTNNFNQNPSGCMSNCQNSSQGGPWSAMYFGSAPVGSKMLGCWCGGQSQGCTSMRPSKVRNMPLGGPTQSWYGSSSQYFQLGGHKMSPWMWVLWAVIILLVLWALWWLLAGNRRRYY